MAPNIGFYNVNGQDAPRSFQSGLIRCGSVGAFRAAAPLPVDTQRVIDNAVVRVGRQRLVIVDDLLSAGLTFPLPNWLAVPTLYWERIGEAGHAQRTMVPKARGERQIMDRAGVTIPIYCTWDDFSFDIRSLLAAERVGSPLDTTHAEQATRNVNEAFEDSVINGIDFNVAGNTVLGLLDSTNTYAYTGAEAWDAAGHTGEEILADVLGMIDVAIADGFYGPYNLYIPTLYGSKINADFKSATSGSTRERLEMIDVGGGQRLTIKVADKLPANRTALVQMTSDVIDLVVGQTPTMVSWEDGPGWERFFVVLGCIIPRIKVNSAGNYGVVVGNTV